MLFIFTPINEIALRQTTLNNLLLQMKWCKAILILLIVFSSKANAQILNIDKTDTADYSPATKASFNFSTGIEIDKQKDILYDATNTLELLVQKNKELYILSGSYRFTYNGPQDFLNTGYIHLRFRHDYRNTFEPESFLQYQWDNKRGLERRALAGANMRYNFWNADKVNLNAAVGLMYEQEKWDYNAVDSQKIPASPVPIIRNLIKVNSYIRVDWKASSNSDLAATLFVQTVPTRLQPRFAPLLQWNIEAGKHTGFSLAFNGLYDVAPIVPINHFYYNFSQSILLKW
jgi:hypothetical protein